MLEIVPIVLGGLVARAIATHAGKRRAESHPERYPHQEWKDTVGLALRARHDSWVRSLRALMPQSLGTLKQRSLLWTRTIWVLAIEDTAYLLLETKRIDGSAPTFVTAFEDGSVLATGMGLQPLTRGPLQLRPCRGTVGSWWRQHTDEFAGRTPSAHGAAEHALAVARRLHVLEFGPAHTTLPDVEAQRRIKARIQEIVFGLDVTFGPERTSELWHTDSELCIGHPRGKYVRYPLGAIQSAFVGEQAGALQVPGSTYALRGPTARLHAFVRSLPETRADRPITLPRRARIGKDGVFVSERFVPWCDVGELRIVVRNRVARSIELFDDAGERRARLPLPAPALFSNALSIHLRRLHHAARPAATVEALECRGRDGEAWAAGLDAMARGGYRDAAVGVDLAEVVVAPATPPDVRLAAAYLLAASSAPRAPLRRAGGRTGWPAAAAALHRAADGDTTLLRELMAAGPFSPAR